VQQTFNGRL